MVIIMHMTLNEHIERAKELHKSGYNCAQSVLMAFAGETGVTPEISARIGAGLGAGASCGEICGVITGINICMGLRGDSDPKSKIPAMKRSKSLITQFESNNGFLRCKDLKGKAGGNPAMN